MHQTLATTIPLPVPLINIFCYNLHLLNLAKKEEKIKDFFKSSQATCLHCPWKQNETCCGYITQWSFTKVKFYSSIQQLKERKSLSEAFKILSSKTQQCSPISIPYVLSLEKNKLNKSLPKIQAIKMPWVWDYGWYPNEQKRPGQKSSDHHGTGFDALCLILWRPKPQAEYFWPVK